MKKVLYYLGLFLLGGIVFAVSFWLNAFLVVGEPEIKKEIFLKSGGREVFVESLEGRRLVKEGVVGERNFVSSSNQRLKIEVGGGEGIMELIDSVVVRSGSGTLFEVLESNDERFVLRLNEGRIWVNGLFDGRKIVVEVDGGSFEFFKSMIDVERKEGVSTLKVLRGIAEVKIGVDGYGGEVLNSLIVTTGGQAILIGKVIRENFEVIAKLLNSKLIKELNVGMFDNEVFLNEDWVILNKDLDLKLLSKFSDEYLAKVRKRGLIGKVEENGFATILRNLVDVFTINKNKIVLRKLNENNELFEDIKFLFDVGRKEEAREKFELFKKRFDEEYLSGNLSLLDKIRKEYVQLGFVELGNSLYELRNALFELMREKVLAKGGVDEQFEILIERMLKVDYLASNLAGREVFKSEIRKMFDELKIFFNLNESKLSGNLRMVSFVNQVLDGWFLIYSEMYWDDFVKLKVLFENKYLDLIVDLEDKNEEKQSLAGRRIDLLSVIKEFILDEKINLDEGKKIVSRLLIETKGLELPPKNRVAVAEVFKRKLEDLALFNSFLNTPDYLASTQRGKNLRERYNNFLLIELKAKDEVSGFVEQIVGDGLNEVLKEFGATEEIRAVKKVKRN